MGARIVSIRLAEHEYRVLAAAAASAHLPLSAWCRERLLNPPASVVLGPRPATQRGYGARIERHTAPRTWWEDVP